MYKIAIKKMWEIFISFCDQVNPKKDIFVWSISRSGLGLKLWMKHYIEMNCYERTSPLNLLTLINNWLTKRPIINYTSSKSGKHDLYALGWKRAI